MDFEEFPRLNFIAQVGKFFVLLASVVGVQPDFWLGNFSFELFDFCEFFVEIKTCPRILKVLLESGKTILKRARHF